MTITYRLLRGTLLCLLTRPRKVLLEGLLLAAEIRIKGLRKISYSQAWTAQEYMSTQLPLKVLSEGLQLAEEITLREQMTITSRLLRGTLLCLLTRPRKVLLVGLL